MTMGAFNMAPGRLLLLILPHLVPLAVSFSNHFINHATFQSIHRHRSSSSSSSLKSNPIDNLNTLLPKSKILSGDAPITIAPSSSPQKRYGIFTTKDMKPKSAVLSIPYDDSVMLTASRARKVFKNYLPDDFEGWTGDVGLVALLLLAELSQSSVLESRSGEVNEFMSAWVQSLPSEEEMSHHPLYWDEDDQEILQSSSTKKIYQLLDDIDEDASWLEERVWSVNRDIFPSKTVNNERDCFTPQGFTWAFSQVLSRSVFIDGQSRLIPILDYANHEDGLEEIEGGKTFGAFGTTKGVQLIVSKTKSTSLKKGEEVCVSYGPKNAIEYLLEYGFVPPQMQEEATNKYAPSYSELTFEVDDKDRFYDDKMDILEFEVGMNPVQTFEVGGTDGEPDPAMVQFLRLAKLGSTDAFLLESIFRKEVWDFMALPVSEKNEQAVVDAIIEACNKALKEMEELDQDKDNETADETDNVADTETEAMKCCKVVRELEKKALTKTLDYMQREREALDLKEYYQERRLKDLGLDSEWNEDEMNPDVGWGQTRAPGGGDLDW